MYKSIVEVEQRVLWSGRFQRVVTNINSTAAARTTPAIQYIIIIDNANAVINDEQAATANAATALQFVVFVALYDDATEAAATTGVSIQFLLADTVAVYATAATTTAGAAN